MSQALDRHVKKFPNLEHFQDTAIPKTTDLDKVAASELDSRSSSSCNKASSSCSSSGGLGRGKMQNEQTRDSIHEQDEHLVEVVEEEELSNFYQRDDLVTVKYLPLNLTESAESNKNIDSAAQSDANSPHPSRVSYVLRVKPQHIRGATSQITSTDYIACKLARGCLDHAQP